jgi:hypothetical protein
MIETLADSHRILDFSQLSEDWDKLEPSKIGDSLTEFMDCIDFSDDSNNKQEFLNRVKKMLKLTKHNEKKCLKKYVNYRANVALGLYKDIPGVMKLFHMMLNNYEIGFEDKWLIAHIDEVMKNISARVSDIQK